MLGVLARQVRGRGLATLTYSWIEYARILRRCMVDMREGVPGAEVALQRWAAQAIDKGKL